MANRVSRARSVHLMQMLRASLVSGSGVNPVFFHVFWLLLPSWQLKFYTWRLMFSYIIISSLDLCQHYSCHQHDVTVGDQVFLGSQYTACISQNIFITSHLSSRAENAAIHIVYCRCLGMMMPCLHWLLSCNCRNVTLLSVQHNSISWQQCHFHLHTGVTSTDSLLREICVIDHDEWHMFALEGGGYDSSAVHNYTQTGAGYNNQAVNHGAGAYVSYSGSLEPSRGGTSFTV